MKSSRDTQWLVALFLLQSLAPGLWIPSLGDALERGGVSMGWATAIFAVNAVAALVSPLGSAALADLRFGAVRTLGGLSLVAAVFLGLASFGLARQWPPVLLWALYLGQALAFLPSWALVSAAAFARLPPERRHRFPLLRLWGTIGWMSAGWLLSYVVHGDASPAAGLWAAATMVALGALCFVMPRSDRPATVTRVDWSLLFGGGARELLGRPALRRALISAALLAVPLAAYYPYTSKLLGDFGIEAQSGRMSWGQASEVLAMVVVATAVRRLGETPLILTGILLAVARYGLYALGWRWQEVGWVQAGIVLHGWQYAFFAVSLQMWIERSVGAESRARAQACLTVLSGGLGGGLGLVLAWLGYAWLVESGPGWEAFWWLWAALCLPSLAWFVGSSRGRPRPGRHPRLRRTMEPSG